jgi:PKD repeat protein
MKYLYSLLIAMVLSSALTAQNCNFTLNISQPSTVTLIPPPGFLPPLFSFNWDYGDGTSDSIYIPIHTYAAPGVYTIVLTVTNTTTNTVACSYTKTVNFSLCGGSYSQSTVNPSLYSFFSMALPGTQINWNFGDGNIGMGQNVLHQYANYGTYVVTMTEIDSAFGSQICSRIFYVAYDSIPVCSFLQSVPDPITAPNVIQFNALVPIFTGPATVVTWDFGDGTSPVSAYDVQHAYASSGVYTVSMQFVSNGDTCGKSQQVNVTANQGTCSFTAVTDSVNQDTYTFSGSTQDTSVYFLWNFGDGTTVIGNNVTHTYAVASSYNVCMQVYDSLTNTVLCSYCQTINTGPQPFCGFIFSSPVTDPQQVHFVSTFPMPNFSYHWDFGDGSTDSAFFSTHNYAVAGNYNVCLTVYDHNNILLCTTCTLINVAATTNCQSYFNAISLGLNAYFIDQSVTPGATVSYLWDFGDGNSSTLKFPAHQYSNIGLYNACLTVASGSCTSTYCQMLNIDTAIIIPLVCNAYFIFTQISPFQLVAVNLSNGNNISFSWDFGDGSPVSTGAYPTHQYGATGSYQICLTVTDAMGCIDTYCDSLSVDSLGNIMYRSTSNTGFTLNVLSPVAITGVDEIAQIKLAELYPVPATDQLFVQWKSVNEDAINYQVISVDGREVMNGNITKQNHSLNTSTLTPGLYLLRVTDANGNADNKTFIKN